MSDVDFLGFGARRNAAFGQFGAKNAASTYANFLAQQRGTRQKFEIGEQYEKDAPRTVSRFSRRGLAGPGVRSGIYARGMTDLGKKNFDDLSRVQFDMDASQNQLGLDMAQNEADYNAQIAEIESQKQAQIAQAAATLAAFKPYLGG